jgi:prepilin-type N-terminal cleavage/methylation domain-containing protein
MSTRSQSGYSLIEIVLVTAIAGMLVVIAFKGFSGLRTQTQFSQAVERATQNVAAQRQEALSTVKTVGTGTDNTTITIGRLLTFTPGSSVVTVQTLTTQNYNAVSNTTPRPGQAVAVYGPETTSFTMPWGIKYTKSSKGNGVIQVAFVRSAVDGTLQTATSPNGGWPIASLTYGNFAGGGAAANIFLANDYPVVASSKQAYITITPVSSGITRTYL